MNRKSSIKTNVVDQISQSLNNLGDQQRKVLLASLIIFFVLAASTTLLLGYIVFEPQLTAFVQVPTVTAHPTATSQCVGPTLTLGAYIYPLEVIPLAEDGSLPIIPGPPGNAWWVSDTNNPFVFIFDPASRSLDLKSVLSPGDQIEVQWADCGQDEFVYTDYQPGTSDVQNLLSLTVAGISVIVQPAGTEQGYILRGQPPELANPPTPEPTSEGAIQMDVTFDETATVTDAATIQTHLTISNRGSASITLSDNDFSLTAEEQPAERPIQVVPKLSQLLQPGDSLSLVITFANPGGHTAALQVLDISINIQY
jgi:hypothetical protein